MKITSQGFGGVEELLGKIDMEDQITFDVDKLAVVPINQVRPNTWNPKEEDTEEYRKVVKAINVLGQRKPIVVRENKGFEIIDGEQRYRACKELEFSQVLIYNEGVVPDEDAKAMTIWYQVQAPFDRVEEAFLVSELAGLDVELPYLEREIEELRALADFDWESFQPDEGEVVETTTLGIIVTLEQRDVILRAIGVLREQEEDSISDGRALELICAEFLAGH